MYTIKHPLKLYRDLSLLTNVCKVLYCFYIYTQGLSICIYFSKYANLLVEENCEIWLEFIQFFRHRERLLRVNKIGVVYFIAVNRKVDPLELLL